MFLWLPPIKLIYKLVPSRLSSRESRLFSRSEPSGNCLNFLKMITYTVEKCDLRPLDFAQKCPQNAGNAISENQISKHFQGGMSLDPPKMCCQFGLTFLERKISVGLPSSTEASTPLLITIKQKSTPLFAYFFFFQLPPRYPKDLSERRRKNLWTPLLPSSNLKNHFKSKLAKECCLKVTSCWSLWIFL